MIWIKFIYLDKRILIDYLIKIYSVLRDISSKSSVFILFVANSKNKFWFSYLLQNFILNRIIFFIDALRLY